MKRSKINVAHVYLALAGALCAAAQADDLTPPPSQNDTLLASTGNILQSVVTISAEKTVQLKNPKKIENDSIHSITTTLLYESLSTSSRSIVITNHGMGFFVSTNGFIMTTAHLVAGADKVDVEVYGKAVHHADIVGVDHDADVSILRINCQQFSLLPQGDSTKVRAGEIAISVRMPLGLYASLQYGTIISNAVSVRIARGQYEDIIQTDLLIGSECAGSPLINGKAQVIGMNVAMLRGTNQTVSGETFAAPINRLNTIMCKIIQESEHLKTKGFQAGRRD